MFEQGKRDRRKELSVLKIDNVFQFLFSILNAAKDWQDKLQSEMPGMYERVVTVRLAPKEGGTNLSMPDPVIKKLTDFGQQAGQRLVNEFDFQENRWRRALSILPELERILPDLHDAIANFEAGKENWNYLDLAREHQSDECPPTSEWREDALLPMLRELSDLGKKIDMKRVQKGVVPTVDANLQLVASPDFSEGQAVLSS